MLPFRTVALTQSIAGGNTVAHVPGKTGRRLPQATNRLDESQGSAARRLEDIGSNDLISCKSASAEIRIVYQLVLVVAPVSPGDPTYLYL